MPDTRHFDSLEKVVADQRRLLDDHISTVLARLAKAGIAVVSATSEIIAPYAGQLIVNATDNMLYEWNGAAWIGVLAMGGSGAQIHEARYNQTANQAITNVTDTKLQFQTAITTSPDVTASLTGNQNFTLNRAGLWRIGAAMGWVASAGHRYLAIQTGSTINHLNRFTQNAFYTNGARAVTNYCSADIRVAAGTVICAIGWHDGGAGVTTDAFFGGSNHINLTWMRP